MQIEDAIEIWRSLKDYIPTKDRQSAAEQFVIMLIDTDIPNEDLWDLAEIDSYLENAVKANLDDFEPEDDEGENESDEPNWDD